MVADLSIVLEPAPQFFRRQLHRAKLERQVATSEVVDTYLIAVLVDHVLPGRLLSLVYDHSIALLLAEALTWHGARRLERLQALGDAVLFSSGFFAERLARAAVDPGFFHGLGARAYAEAGRMLEGTSALPDPTQVPDLFAELAAEFPALVEVLREMALALEAEALTGHAGILSLYERWLATGSSTLAQALAQRGVVPTRDPSTRSH